MESTFLIFGGAMSALQFYAANQIKHMPIDEISIVLGAVCLAATTYLLANSYQRYRESMRPKIFVIREDQVKLLGSHVIEGAAATSSTFESTYLAITYANALYGFLTLVFAWFILKDANVYVNYAVASVAPAFLVLLFASMDASKRKSKL